MVKIGGHRLAEGSRWRREQHGEVMVVAHAGKQMFCHFEAPGTRKAPRTSTPDAQVFNRPARSLLPVFTRDLPSRCFGEGGSYGIQVIERG
jgi:hypothetical protein